jgi:16S rRNA C1402 (ribose-2'-O) methylase RsmI
VRGEVVVVVEGRREPAPPDVDAAVAEARRLVAAGTRKRAAAREAAERGGVGVNEIYRTLLQDDA